MKNAEVRTQLMQNCKVFLKRACHYSYSEEQAVKACLDVLKPVDAEFEKFNERNPGHGKPMAAYSREECPFMYCDSSNGECEKNGHCHHVKPKD